MLAIKLFAFFNLYPAFFLLFFGLEVKVERAIKGKMISNAFCEVPPIVSTLHAVCLVIFLFFSAIHCFAPWVRSQHIACPLVLAAFCNLFIPANPLKSYSAAQEQKAMD